jgi:hypothetical protein
MTSSEFEFVKRPQGDELDQDTKALDKGKIEEDLEDPKPLETLNESTSEYPHGARLVIILVSLMLSTFLVALDNVSRWLAMEVK